MSRARTAASPPPSHRRRKRRDAPRQFTWWLVSGRAGFIGGLVVQLLQRSEGMCEKRLIGLALVLLAAVVVAASSRLHGAAEAAVELVGAVIQQHPGWGVAAFVVLAALSAMLAFFSSVVVVPIAAHQWGDVATVALLWVGWLLGGASAYAIGRFLGARVVRRLVSPVHIRYYEDRMNAHAPFWMILLLQLAVPSEIPGYVLGSMRCRFSTYFLALALAEFPFALGAVFLSSGFLGRQYWTMLAVGVTGIGFLAWAIRRLHRELGDTPRAAEAGRSTAAAPVSTR